MPSRDSAPAASEAVKSITDPVACSAGFTSVMWPRRRATEATSIEVSPPPTTTTFCAVPKTQPLLKASRNSMPSMQFSASSQPGIGSGRPFCAPSAQKIASKLFSISSSDTSTPTRVLVCTSTPMSMMRPISLSSISRGVR